MSDPCNLGRGHCKHATDKALLVYLEAEPTNEFWIPKSQIHDDSEVYGESMTGDVIVSLWWAEKANLA